MTDKTPIPQDKKVSIEALNPKQVPIMQVYGEIEKLYSGVRQQEEKTKNMLKALREEQHRHAKDRNGKYARTKMVQDVTGFKSLSIPENLKEFRENLNKTIMQIENQLNGITEQRRHRGDDLGEKRVEVFKLFGRILKTQHGVSYKDMLDYLEEKSEVKDMRPSKDIDAVIKQALGDVKKDA